jgi:hypothetical protein
MLFALAFATAAPAADVEQDLTWAVTLDGQAIGERSATIKWSTTAEGDLRRMVEAWTELDATVLGVDYKLRERLTAMMTVTAASVHATTDLNGQVTEVQARRNPASWTVTIGVDGRESTREWPTTAIDLSTADFLDPDTRVPIGGYTSARVLAIETGDIVDGPVKRLGAGQIPIGTFTVPVEGYQWTTEAGEGRFWYTADGYLVRYEHTILGKHLMGTLTLPPPAGTDDAPVIDNGSSEVQEIKL